MEKWKEYERVFKALADSKRLELLHLLAQTPQDAICVCDLTEALDMAQSKLSYHIKILLDASLITKEKRGTWNYYALNHSTINHVLSEELCCLLRGPKQSSSDACCNE